MKLILDKEIEEAANIYDNSVMKLTKKEKPNV